MRVTLVIGDKFPMVYSNKFVLAVLLDGRPQEELANGVVKLPFGAEYSLRFRNKHNRRAVVKIYVDGENVSGSGYIIPANDHVDIKRHWDKDRSFKFVELNSPEAVDAGKNGPNTDKSKGVIEAHFYLEKEYKYTPPPVYRTEEHHHHHHYPRPYYPWPVVRPTWCDTPPVFGTRDGAQYSSGEIKVICDAGLSGLENIGCNDAPTAGGAAPAGGQHFNASRGRKLKLSSIGREQKTLTCSTESLNEGIPQQTKSMELRDGCTVEGHTTGQTFTTQWIDVEETYTTLKVFLQGYEDDAPVQVADEPKKIRKTNKESRIDDLEAENERLRKELAEIENAKLKAELEKVKQSKKAPRKRKKKEVAPEEGAKS
jgi:hypothetical protein